MLTPSASAREVRLTVSPPSDNSTNWRSALAPEKSVRAKFTASYIAVSPWADSFEMVAASKARSVVSGALIDTESANEITPTGTSIGSTARKLMAAALAAAIASPSFMLADVSMSNTTSRPALGTTSSWNGTDLPPSRSVTLLVDSVPPVRPAGALNSIVVVG
ncbi:unannotated protein [freshwater metagenome]|uniref:Unannotated protein n=1 Tax=freshwater metagenome TaxID=449393 RepID=A0A6J6P2B1_9ZZZZ